MGPNSLLRNGANLLDCSVTGETSSFDWLLHYGANLVSTWTTKKCNEVTWKVLFLKLRLLNCGPLQIQFMIQIKNWSRPYTNKAYLFRDWTHQGEIHNSIHTNLHVDNKVCWEDFLVCSVTGQTWFCLSNLVFKVKSKRSLKIECDKSQHIWVFVLSSEFAQVCSVTWRA